MEYKKDPVNGVHRDMLEDVDTVSDTWARSPGVRLATPDAPRAGRHSSRRAAAQRVSSLRFESCSLRSTAETWVSTVFTEMKSSPATSR